MIDQSQLEPIADRIYRAGLSVPAIFFLELHKPLTTLIHTSAAIGAPLAEPFFGQQRYRSIMQFFESRESAEQLIQMLEQRLENRAKV
jgi:hypothetical protein